MFTSTAVMLSVHVMLRLKRSRRNGERVQTRMPMRSPSDLGSSAYDVREYVGGRPWIRIIYQAIDFVIRCVVDSESLLDEIFPDEGS